MKIILRTINISLILLLMTGISACGKEANSTKEKENSRLSGTDLSKQDETFSDNVCYSELNLTDEECINSGTHEYSYSFFIEGIGETPCALDNGSTSGSGYSKYTFTFQKGGGLNYAHPEEEIWNETTHSFVKNGKNNYEYTGSNEGMNELWEVTFTRFGFHEKLTLTWDCATGICGCFTSSESDIFD